MATYTLKKLKTYDAHGGLSRDFLDNNPALKAAEYSSTKAGRYVIQTIGKHVSAGRWILSSISWGTPIRFNQAEQVIYVQKNGKMVKLSAYNSQWGAHSDKKLYEELLKMYEDYYKDYYKNSFPDTWIFNDFGHVTIKYFKDINGDFVLNKSERIQSDFLHTTQIDEAVTAYNKTVAPKFARPITLTNSHGCIHVKPENIDEIISNGYLSRGSNIEIHAYEPLLMVPNTLEIKNANPAKMFEVHFFPLSSKNNRNVSGKGQLVVYSIMKKN